MNAMRLAEERFDGLGLVAETERPHVEAGSCHLFRLEFFARDPIGGGEAADKAGARAIPFAILVNHGGPVLRAGGSLPVRPAEKRRAGGQKQYERGPGSKIMSPPLHFASAFPPKTSALNFAGSTGGYFDHSMAGSTP